MKKPKPKRRNKAPSRRAGIPDLSPEQLEQLSQILASALSGADPFDDDDDDESDAAGMFADYLDSLRSGDIDDDEKEGRLGELLGRLTLLAMEVNNEEAGAQEKWNEVRDRLDDALDGAGFAPVDLLMTSKLIAEAGFAVPDRLKQALADELAKGPQPALPNSDGDGPLSLGELAAASEHDPFAMHQQLSAMYAGLPDEWAINLIRAYIEGADNLGRQALAGFVLHPDAAMAAAAAEALAAAVAKSPAESLLLERVVRIRPWLPAERQPAVDALIKAMRQNARPPEKAQAPKVTKLALSACDGAGGHTVSALAKSGRTFAMISVLMKPKGVIDAVAALDLGRPEADSLYKEAMGHSLSEEADAAGAARMLTLSLADNLASGTPPPYRLVQFVETLGLGPLPPRPAPTSEIIDELLFGLAPDLTDEAAVERAEREVSGLAFPESWFESGVAVDEVLRPRRRFAERVRALVQHHLPRRREFWARQCALSALALSGPGGEAPPALSVEFALVGRDLMSVKPIETLPIIRAIAEQSARAYAAHRGE